MRSAYFVVAVALSGLLIVSAGCARFGYTNRVLHRVPSPNGQVVAICQEVPVFDGPEFDVRLERADRSLIRQLFHMGDGGGVARSSGLGTAGRSRCSRVTSQLLRSLMWTGPCRTRQFWNVIGLRASSA